MNYCEFHLGDYAKAANHLSMLEHGAYFGLLRKYYSSEKPLPPDLNDVQRLVGARTDEEKAATTVVLREFFVLSDDGYHQARCNQEIARYREKQQKARQSANARWNASKSHSVCDATAIGLQSEGSTNASTDAMRSHSKGSALQAPDTKPQSSVPDGTGAAGAADMPPAAPPPPDGEPGAAPVMTALEAVAIMNRVEGAPLSDDDEKLLWAGGRALFALSNISAENAGKFVGKLVKDNGNDRALVFDVLRAACLERPIDPRGWMTATCQSRRGQRVSTTNKQTALEEQNFAAALEFAKGKN